MVLAYSGIGEQILEILQVELRKAGQNETKRTSWESTGQRFAGRLG